MKNKFFIFCLILFLNINFNYKILANEFNFKSGILKIKDNGKLIEATKNVEILTDNSLKIYADKSILQKEISLLEASGNVRLIDVDENINMKANFISYDKVKNLIYVKGKSSTTINNNFIVNSNNLFYDKKKNIIYSNYFTEMTDKIGNKINVDKFELNVNSKVAIVKSVKFKDKDNNILNLDEAQINLNNNEVAGKEIKLFFDKNIFGNNENDPRVYGRSMVRTENEIIIKKGVFTSCKFRENEKCPPWLMKAEQVKHNKKKKTIEYKNAWLNIYDKPVAYFPTFYHPDPTVKRQSGFLMPKINNSNFLGTSFQIPYYKVIANNKDFTVSPRIFFNDKILIQSEYRQVEKNSKTTLDNSFARDDDGTTSHFFGNFISSFGNNELQLNLETTSKNSYLKKYEIKSPLIDDNVTLNSFISLENFNAEKSTYFLSSVEVFEDLTKDDSDKYEYIYPNLLYQKIVENENNSNLIFSTSLLQKKYETNKYDGVNINDLTFISNTNISDKGFINDYNFILKNVNTDGKHSSIYKNNMDQKLLTKLIFNSKYPLSKINDNHVSYFTPSLTARYSPNKNRNIKNKDIRLEYLNLFDRDRLQEKDILEGGESLTLGFDYKITDKENTDLVELSAGQVFRLQENEDLPINTTIGQTRSDIIGKLKLIPSDVMKLNYSYIVDNDFKDINYNFVETDFIFNKINTSFKFLESKDFLGEKSYLSNETNININTNHSIGFGTNKNLDINLTEYYDLVYQYNNDCLTAAIEYRKSYYKDVDIEPDENIFLSIVLPFGKINSPTLN